jgi:hypothetical protein
LGKTKLDGYNRSITQHSARAQRVSAETAPPPPPNSIKRNFTGVLHLGLYVLRTRGSPMSPESLVEQAARIRDAVPSSDGKRFAFRCAACGNRTFAEEKVEGEITTHCGCRFEDARGDNHQPEPSTSHNGANPSNRADGTLAQSNAHRPVKSPNGAPGAAVQHRRTTSKLPYAIAYARRSIAVFPLHNIESDRECSCGKLQCSSAGKHPRLNDWQALATRDEAQIAAWWKQWPDSNVGVKCGRDSDLTVLDVDGDAGRETLRDLEMENGELPETPIAITGSGGAHYYFKFEDGVGNAVRFAPGLDVRTEGGLVVGVGSITKRPYVWEEAFRLGELALARMPSWLADRIKVSGNKGGQAPGKVMVPAVETMIEGSGRHNRMWQLGRSLRAQRFPDEAIVAALRETNNKFATPMAGGELEPLIHDILTLPDRPAFQAPMPNSSNGAAGALPMLAAVLDGAALAELETKYADRMSIEASIAYQQIISDQREYSWDHAIKDGCTAVIAALIGAGKTTYAMNLARAWALELEFLGRPCRQSKTLVVVSPKEYEAWADTIGFWGLKDLIYLVESTKAHFPDRNENVKWFDFLMQRNGCRTFVLDTLFDFFGMPPNTSGDSNRIAMNEQAPLLQLVRERNYSGLVTGHSPKSEANAIQPRDPEEAFGGHTAWTAQHRMRMTIGRRSQGVNTFLTGRGGYGDQGFLTEQLLRFDESTRLLALGGPFSERIGEAAMPSMIEALRGFDRPVTAGAIMRATLKSERWVRAGLNAAVKAKDSQVKRLEGTKPKSGKKAAALYVLADRAPRDETELPLQNGEQD